MATITKRIEFAVTKYRREIALLAEEFHANTLVPFCKENDLYFVVTNDSFFFRSNKTDTFQVGGLGGISYLASKSIREKFDPIFSVLKLELESNVVFGFYCPNVDKVL